MVRHKLHEDYKSQKYKMEIYEIKFIDKPSMYDVILKKKFFGFLWLEIRAKRSMEVLRFKTLLDAKNYCKKFIGLKASKA